MAPGGFLRRIVVLLLVAISVLFVIAGVSSPRGQSTLVLGLLGLVGAYFLLGRPGLRRRPKKQSTPVFMPSQVEQRPRPTTVSAKRAPSSATSAVFMERLSPLPTPAKISIV